jgi:FtsP/CotA-like multicopper oxidase with cupredoxin domain
VIRGLLAAALLLALLAPSSSGARKPAPARFQVVAEEFTLALSRRTLRAGPAIVELANFGEDPHDLKLRRQARGAPTLTIREVEPNQQAQLRARLAPGRFVLWCSVADHRQRGMRAVLTVRRASS